MNPTTMQTARESFLKNHYLDKASLEVLYRAEDLSTLLITVEAFDSTEQGVFSYNPESNEFYLDQDVPFFVRTHRRCSKTGKCYKDKKFSRTYWKACLARYSGEKVHSFERFLQMCLQDFYELTKIEEK